MAYTLKTFILAIFLLSFSLLVVAQGTGTQFITGPCKSDADCASGCCGFKSGLCAGPIIAQTRDGGCGFGDAQPNSIAAQKLGFKPAATSAAAAPAASAAAPVANANQNPAGAGNGAGKQFITGVCKSDADCASGCCGFKSGLCAGAIIAQTRDGGCGFGDAQPNSIAAQKLGFKAAVTSAAAAAPAATAASLVANANQNPAGAGNGAGKQFITGVCKSDADCASGCCGFKSGLCAGPIIAQTRDGGCGFGDAQPNSIAAQKLGFKPAATSAAAAPAASAAAPVANANQNPAEAGNGAGKQFITGVCKSDADCASGCCGFKSGLCAGAIIAQTRDGGCGFGNAQPNDIAAQKLRG